MQTNNTLSEQQKDNPKEAEQRQDIRESVIGWDATLYANNKQIIEAVVVDSSRDGAGLVIACQDSTLEKNHELTLTISTGAKRFTCRGYLALDAQGRPENTAGCTVC